MLVVLAAQLLHAQQQEVVHLSAQKIEQRFLTHNLQILAHKYAIEQAQAEVLQAKLWPNPTFSISEVNLWSNGTAETLPALAGNYGQHQQVGFSLEQLIETSGKRKKRIRFHELEAVTKEYEFQEVLRILKFELRSALHEWEALQAQTVLWQKQLSIFEQLEKAYARQLQLGNVTEMDYVRIAAEKLQLQTEYKELLVAKNEHIQLVKTWIAYDDPAPIELQATSQPTLDKNLTVEQLYVWALEHRTDFLGAQNEQKVQQQWLKVEQAEKIPDVTFSLNYDRAGSIMRDFVGIGFSFDVPLWNRNQGNIQKAKIGIDIATAEATALQFSIKKEVEKQWLEVLQWDNMLQDNRPEFQSQLENALEVYTRNFQNRTISILEFIDFIQVYQNHTTQFIEHTKKRAIALDELHFIIGKDF